MLFNNIYMICGEKMDKDYESAIKEIDKLVVTKKEDKNKKHEERWREAYTQVFGKDLNLQKIENMP